MNLRRHVAVLWRFRFIVFGTVLVGIALAILALFQVSSSGLQWRDQETFGSQSTLLVTQPGFPEGRVVLGDTTAAAQAEQQLASPKGKGKEEQFADPGRFSNLAVVYSYLAQSDQVRLLMRPVPQAAQLSVVPLTAGFGQVTLPILQLNTSAHTPAEAKALNQAAITALQGFLATQQQDNGISRVNRVRVGILNPPSAPVLTVGRSKTPAVVAFILTLAVGLALAYCLDNLFPPRRAGGDDVAAAPVPSTDDDAPAHPSPAAALEEVWLTAPRGAEHGVTRRVD
jgi:hypothetical protein